METTIVEVKHAPLNLPLTEPFTIATGEQQLAQNVLVSVKLQNGITGLGEAAPFPAVSGETQHSTLASLEKLKPLLLNKDVENWETISAEMRRTDFLGAAARCALEMAMLDALTQHRNIPLYQFFGNACTPLHTDMTITAAPEKNLSKLARSIYNSGIQIIKIKTVGKDIDLDVQRVRTIREAVPQAKLLVDGNGGYSFRDALLFLERLEALNLKLILFEQPLPREDWNGMAELAKFSPVPLCADEAVRALEDVQRIVDLQMAQVINIKLMKCGVSESLKMIALAKQNGLKLMIGGMVESILAMTFSAHLAYGTGSFEYVDLDTPQFIASHPFVGGFAQQGDLLHLPEVPGLGVRLKL